MKDVVAEIVQGAGAVSVPANRIATRIDAYRFSWESWTEDGKIIVGLLDHQDHDEHMPMFAFDDTRDAGILLSVLRGLDAKTPGGLPFNPEPTVPS